MNVHVFLLVCLLIFSLALLCALCWLHHGPSKSRAAKVRTALPRLLKPRSPHDCPACRLASTPAPSAGPAPLPVRPWSEVKCRRGAPKRIPTEGFACPNRQCTYFGNTDAHRHALVGEGKHGKAERIQTFRCQACRACAGYFGHPFKKHGICAKNSMKEQPSHAGSLSHLPKKERV